MHPDYAGQNLQGRSFKDQNLTGANFSKADIRGANFTDAILKDADFTGAKAGLQRIWLIRLLIISYLMSAILAVFSILIGSFLQQFFYAKSSENFFAGIISLVILTAFYILTIRKGLTAGFGFLAGALAFIPAGGFAGGYIFTGVTTVAGILSFSGGLIFALTFAVTVAFAFTFALTFALAGAFAFIFAIAFAFALTFVLAFLALPLVQVTGALLSLTFTLALAFTLAGVFTLFSAYIGWYSLVGDEKYAWVRLISIAFAATGGTSFHGADLTDAYFTGAILKNTDFRKANLTRTRFYEAKKLDFARVDHPTLTNQGVLNLLVTGNGRRKSYAGANLKGANLIGADLKEANLKDADITEATFQGACLEWTNLTLAQAVGTNFTSAQMTGACVEAWNIESTTKLDNVDCRFIYLLENPKPETDNRERRPSNGEFKPGEFTKLFEEVLSTVDLIFRDGIDWKAFVTAFKKVQVENEGTELAIQSIENKGDGVVVVKVAVPDDADKEKIHSNFTQKYQLALQAVEEKYKSQLQAKDEQIVIYRQQSADMKEIVSLLANKPINVKVDNKVDNKNMTNSNDSSRNINVGRDFNATGTINLGEISGAVTNTINELPTSTEPNKQGIKELLTQLQTAIEDDTNLNQEDKAEALEQVKTLAEAGKSPQEGAIQKTAKTAMKILKGTIASLPTTATLVEAGSKLLPLISKLLGLG